MALYGEDLRLALQRKKVHSNIFWNFSEGNLTRQPMSAWVLTASYTFPGGGSQRKYFAIAGKIRYDALGYPWCMAARVDQSLFEAGEP